MQEVGWENRNPKELQKAFETSSFIRFAFRDNELIGFGRTIDDGKYYALIVDLVVSPAHQRKGVGTRLLSELKNSLNDYVFTTLTSAWERGILYQSGLGTTKNSIHMASIRRTKTESCKTQVTVN